MISQYRTLEVVVMKLQAGSLPVSACDKESDTCPFNTPSTDNLSFFS